MSERPTFWLLFPPGCAPPSVGRVGSLLRAFDVTLKNALVEGIARVGELDAQISLLGHVLHLSHHATTAPEYFIDASIGYSGLRKAGEAREHEAFLVLTHLRGPGTLLEQHLLLTLVSAALAELGARFVVNPRSRSLLPTAAFDRAGRSTIEMLMSISNLVLITGVHRFRSSRCDLLVTRGLDAWGSQELGIELKGGEAEARLSFKVLEEVVGHILRTGELLSEGDRVITARGAFGLRASIEEERVSSPALLVLTEVRGDLTPIVEP